MKRFLSKFILVLSLFFASVTVLGQLNYTDVDQRIIDVYGEDRVQLMIVEQPDLINYLNYYVRNSYQVLYDIPARKLVGFEDISTLTNTRTGVALTANDLYQINILLVSVTRKSDQYLTYKVGETGTVIVFIAPQFLLEQYNEQKANAGGNDE